MKQAESLNLSNFWKKLWSIKKESIMYFQLNGPSIPAIRAKFLIEKLRTFRQSEVSISLCATGRTGSGKTTLGNRLIGIDYFMPSTGRQDCTDEVNLVEFPIGLKYFDLPGVCSDDRLENYNRAALGIDQIDDFDIIDTLTLAKYTENQSTQRQRFSVSSFQEAQLNPDLIFYLIAPDKQFLSIDSAYLKDLLKKHRHKIIYIFNILADKETGNVFAATEQNIRDVSTRIKKVHTSVLGSENAPIIVPINCWTGEGISELVSHSHQMLGDEKGNIFEQLIQYQQQQTPNEYLYQIKRELIRLFSYAACQKPEGTYSCNQPIHQACHTLWDFLANFRDKAGQTESHLIEQINSLISQVLSDSPDESSQETVSSFEEDLYSIRIGLDYISEGIDYLNEEINSRLTEAQNTAIEFRDSQIKTVENEIELRGKDMSSIEENLIYEGKKYDVLAQEIRSIEAEIESHQEKHNSLVEDFNSVNEEIGSQINKYNSKMENFRVFAIELSNRIDKYNARMARYKLRLQAYNSSVDEINASSYYVSQSTIDTLETEKSYLRAESNYLSDESDYLDEQITKRDNKASQLEEREYDIQSDISGRDKIESQIGYEDNYLERLRNSGIAKIKAIEKQQQVIQQHIKLRSEKIKLLNEYVEFFQKVLNSFSEEFRSIIEQKDSRIDDINSQLKTVIILTEKYQQENVKTLKPEIYSFQSEIFTCLENMNHFGEEINILVEEIEGCVAKMAINTLIVDVIMQCTTYHFDSTGECEYKGSTYHPFGKEGIALLLTLAHLITSDKEIGSAYHTWYKGKKVDGLNFNSLTENDVKELLEHRINYSLFEASFDKAVKKVVS
jgi:hypothetical protein